MSFVFEIPKRNKDLIEDPNCSNYFVRQVYEINEISKYLRSAYQALKASDAFYIFNHFDTFFSVIENAPQLQIDHLMRAVDILYQTTDNLGQILDNYLKQDTLDRQNDFLNLIQMVIYLLVNTIRAMDNSMKDNIKQSKAAGRKNKRKDDSLPIVSSYNQKRYEVMLQMCNIMQLPIEKLWNMSIIEDDFVNLLCDLAYRSLVLPSIMDNQINNVIFQILGTAIKQYRHGIAFPVQIVEIMDREESAVAPIARGVRYLNDEFGISTVLENLLKELIEKVNVNPITSVTSKHLSLFISELGEISPELSLQCLDMSEDLINLEPYGIRNSLFGIIQKLLTGHLYGEDLNDDQKSLRDECFEDLYNHINDVNSYVRSKVLQILNDLKFQNAVPLEWMLRIVNRTIERLSDKTATVRKNAISLLKSFLESNPFSSKLEVDIIEEKLQVETKNMQIIREKSREQCRNQKKIASDFDERCVPQLFAIFTHILSDKNQIDSLMMSDKMSEIESHERIEKIRHFLRSGEFAEVAEYIIQVDALCDNQDVWRLLPIDQQILFFIKLLKSYLFDDFESQIEKQLIVIGFLEDELEFTKAMIKAVPKVEELLSSVTATDVLEAIDFFKIGYLFKIKGTAVGMRLMMRLLYINTGQDKNDKGEAVMKAYHQILFATDATGREHHFKVVCNLCTFLQQITVGEYSAFELMIMKWIRSGDIDVNIISILFERYTFKLPETTMNTARCCLELLILISRAKPAIAKNNMKLIIDIVNSRRILEDPRIYSSSLQLLMTSFQPSSDQNIDNDYHPRFEDKQAIDDIILTLKRFFFYPKLPDFEVIATQAINFLYKMCNAPDVLCQEIIQFLCKKLVEISEKQKNRMTQGSETEVNSTQNSEMLIPNYLLPRIIFIFGYIATKEMIYLNDDVMNNMKYRNELYKDTNSQNQSSLNETSVRPLKRLISIDEKNNENDTDDAYMGATAEDSLEDLVNDVCENELVGSANGLLHHFVPILIEILTHPGKYNDDYVQRAAVLALMRFMAVSGVLCLKYISFLMNILRNSKIPSMKCNIIIGLADLTGKFANTIEPWVPHFYTLLLENDDTVRLATLKMLSYVILQAIIRVTGEISDIAACIIDENIDIQNAAKEFFRQLANSKEQEYFKVMPDLISRLSSNESPMPEEKFRIIARSLFELIHKDRQVDNMVEKLCHRFRNTNSERQWRDTAFCLSLLNPTEKAIKKLIEYLPNYKDKIQCDEIFDCFKLIIANANKQVMKPGLKEITKEFDAKLHICLEAGNVSLDMSTLEIEKYPLDNKSKKKGKKVTKKKPRYISSDDDVDDFEENIPTRRASKRKCN